MSEKQFKFTCEKCNYNTNLKHMLLQHYETNLHKTGKKTRKSVKEKEIYKCKSCDFTSINKNTKEERSLKFKFYCEKCDFGVFTESTFDVHKNTIRHNRLNK